MENGFHSENFTENEEQQTLSAKVTKWLINSEGDFTLEEKFQIVQVLISELIVDFTDELAEAEEPAEVAAVMETIVRLSVANENLEEVYCFDDILEEEKAVDA